MVFRTRSTTAGISETQADRTGHKKKKAQNLVATHLARVSPSPRDRQVIKLSDFVGLLKDIDSVEVETVDAPGKTILATKELIHSLAPRQGALVV